MENVPKPPYPKAPIIEAVIQLRVPVNVSTDIQQKLVKRFSKTYPHSQQLAQVSITIDTTGGEGAVKQEPQGFRLNSVDQLDVLVVAPNAVSTARLAPYSTWEPVRDRAKAAWEEWKRTTNSGAPDRIGIRYINRIDIPLRGAPQLDFDQYLKFYPRVPPLGKGALTGYMIQATSPTNHPLWKTSITSAVVPPPIIDHVSLLLDIDVFRTEQIPGRDADLWAEIENGRTIKNLIFESCITDKSRVLFA